MIKVSQIAIIGLFTAMLAACGMSKQEIANTVQQSMQQTFNSDLDLKEYNLKVDKVDLIKKSSNSYKGIASVRYKDETHDVSVDVTVDNESVFWEAPPGSFMFVARDKLKNLFQ